MLLLYRRVRDSSCLEHLVSVLMVTTVCFAKLQQCVSGSQILIKKHNDASGDRWLHFSAGKPWLLPTIWMLLWWFSCKQHFLLLYSLSAGQHCKPNSQNESKHLLRSTSVNLKCPLDVKSFQISKQSSLCKTCRTNRTMEVQARTLQHLKNLFLTSYGQTLKQWSSDSHASVDQGCFVLVDIVTYKSITKKSSQCVNLREKGK